MLKLWTGPRTLCALVLVAPALLASSETLSAREHLDAIQSELNAAEHTVDTSMLLLRRNIDAILHHSYAVLMWLEEQKPAEYAAYDYGEEDQDRAPS